jgi:hypothetical protein
MTCAYLSCPAELRIARPRALPALALDTAPPGTCAPSTRETTPPTNQESPTGKDTADEATGRLSTSQRPRRGNRGSSQVPTRPPEGLPEVQAPPAMGVRR